jgi:PAS domain S-box-containing protein
MENKALNHQDFSREYKHSFGDFNLVADIIDVVNSSSDHTEKIKDMLSQITKKTGVGAAAIRVKKGDDYPYYYAVGFPATFVESEKYISRRDPVGAIVRDSEGKPYLECMCGNVICGRGKPSIPFYTQHGSFWTNSTSDLLTIITEEDGRVRLRNQCNQAGYESVALIPLLNNNEIIGLLQLNDRRKGIFSHEMIRFFEEFIGASVETVLSQIDTGRSLKQSKETVRALLNASTEGMMLIDPEGTILAVNAAVAERFDRPQKDLIGVCAYDLFPAPVSESRKKRLEEVLRARKSIRFEDRRNGRIFDSNIQPLFDEDGKIEQLAIYSRDITQYRKTELRLKKKEQILEIKNKNLEELNAALKLLLKEKEESQKELRENILINYQQLIKPYIEKLENNDLNPNQKICLYNIKSNINEIISPFTKQLSSDYFNLTPTEIQVANLIKAGKITKEIAELLNVSRSAVAYHRYNIRKKLDLKNKKVNLRSSLLSLHNFTLNERKSRVLQV